MNIEKIKNYNQKMLAALSTILVAIAVIGLISIITFVIIELKPHRTPQSNTLLSDKKVEQLNKESLRQQIISYDTPRLVDTLNLIYIIPVNVKTLHNPEEANREVLGLLDIKASSSSGYSSSYYYGSFNNLIVYDFKKGTSEKISTKRMIGTDLLFNYFDDEIVLTFTGSERDTDLDDKVTLLDFSSLFIFSLKDRRLREVAVENSTVNSLKHVENKKDILISFGYDRNKDNLFDSETEPSFVMKYDYKNETLTADVNNDLEKELQKIIDKN